MNSKKVNNTIHTSNEKADTNHWHDLFESDLSTVKNFLSQSDKIWNSLSRQGWLNLAKANIGTTIPAVNIEETEQAYILTLAAPA